MVNYDTYDQLDVLGTSLPWLEILQVVKLDLLGNGELNLGDWALEMRTICLFASQQQPAGLLMEVTVVLLPFFSLSLSLWCSLNLLSL